MSNGTQSNSGTVGAQQAQLSPPPRVLPIVVVPGVMGTRLKDPVSGDLVWNPMGSPFGNSPGDFAAVTARLENVGSPLDPAGAVVTQAQFEAETRQRERRGIATSTNTFARQLRVDVPHFDDLVPDFYDGLVIALQGGLPRRLRPHGYTPRVFCCGYDWRLNNQRSGLRLQTVVNEAIAASNGEQVILIAHSM